MSLLTELRALEKQAAEELEQWSEKRKPTTDDAAALSVEALTSRTLAHRVRDVHVLKPKRPPGSQCPVLVAGF